MFSLKLSVDSPTLTLGNAPFDTMQNSIDWHRVLNPYFWSLTLLSASIGDQFHFKLTGKEAVLDSSI